MIYGSTGHAQPGKVVEGLQRSVTHRPDLAVSHTIDRDEAHQIMTSRYKRHSLKCVTETANFDFLHASAKVSVGSFNILRYGAGVEIDPGSFENFYMLEMPLSGGTEICVGSKTLRSNVSRATVLSPGQNLNSFWHPDTTQMMLKIDRKAVTDRWMAHHQGIEGRWPLFEQTLDLNSSMGWRVKNLMLLLFEDLKQSIKDDQWNLDNETISTAIVDSLLANFDSDGTSRLGGEHHQVLPHHIKLCVQFAEKNLQSDLSIGRFATVAGRSERSVFDGFRRFTQKTPMQYVLDLRLTKARQLLCHSDLSVSDVARLVGCRHMGRFAGHYAHRFGETPSQTIARNAQYPAQCWPDSAAPIQVLQTLQV